MARQPIEVFFATNRDLVGTEGKPKFGEGFHTLGPHYIRYGRGMVVPPAESGGEYKVKSVKLAKEKIPKRRRTTRILGSDEIFESIRSQMSAGDMDTVILIHGFASTFNTALKRAAEIKQKYRYGDRELNVLVFSWPANGEMVPLLSYYSDRNDAQASGVAMARSFLRLREFLENLGQENFCRQSLHLVAHSMGNYALRHAVQAIRAELGNDIERIFEHIFLMAADEDDDAFEKDHKLRLLPALAKAVHVYHSPDDVALMVSDKTKFKPDRLGAEGPRSKDGLPRKVTLVDCRRVDETKRRHRRHQYYRARQEVWEDVRQVLSGKALDDFEGRRYLPDGRSFQIIPFSERD